MKTHLTNCIKNILALCCVIAFMYSTPAWGQCTPNTADPSCDGLAATNYDNVVIGETSGDSGQSDGCNDGIVEILGPAGTNIGCMVVSNSEWAVLIPPNTTIPADGVFLIACSTDPTGACGVGGTFAANGNGLIGSDNANGGVDGDGDGDFNAGLIAEIDLDVCDPNNANFYDPAATGFTLDNSSADDGDQVMLFTPDGTPWDGIYWGTSATTPSGSQGPGGYTTVGGASGNSDHVTIQVAGQTYTLGDNDGNGVVNDNPTTVGGGRGDMGNATAVPVLPTDAACPCNTPANPGTYTMPSLSDSDFWFNMSAAYSPTFIGCNSSYVRGGPRAGVHGSPSHMDGEVTSTTTDANGQNLDNGGGATGGTTGDAFTPGSYTPTNCVADPTTAIAQEWGYTDHPTPGQPNNDPAFVFYVDQTVLCDFTTPITFTVEVYNYQHVSDDQDADSGVDNLQSGSLVNDPILGDDQSWNTGTYVVTGETTVMTYTVPAGTFTMAGAYDFDLVWDDFSNCCGTSGNPGNQSNPNECYETETITITVAEPFLYDCDGDGVADGTQTPCNISCDPAPPAPGTINANSFITGGTGDYTFTLVDLSGTNANQTNTTGVFQIPTDGTANSGYQIDIVDNGTCGFADLMITIDDNCELPPVCPSAVVNMGTTADGAVCPGDMVDLCLNGTDLPLGGTICWYGTTDGTDPIIENAAMGTVTIGTTAMQLGCVDIPASAAVSGGPVLNEVLYDPAGADGSNACEAVEIAGTPGTDLSCHMISDGDFVIVIPAGEVIPPDGFYVISSGSCPATDDYPPSVVDLNLSTCGCTNATGIAFNLTNSGEFIGFFDATGVLVDGIIFEENVDGNSNGPSGQSLTVTNPTGCSNGTLNIPAVADYDVPPAPWNYLSTNVVDESIALDQDVTGNWTNPGGNTIGASNGGGPAAPACLSYTIPDLCAQSPATINIEGLIEPIDMNCVNGDFNYVGATSMFTIDCPTASITSAAFDVCFADQTSVDIPVTITGGTGAYTLTYDDGSGNMVMAGFNSGDNITINGPTTGEIKISLVAVADEGGAMCTGSVGTDEVCVNIRPSEDVQLSTTVQPSLSCTACDGQVTFELASGTSTNNFDIDYTVNGTPQTISSVSLPFTITNACPGEYEITGVTDEGGCPGNVLGNAQTVGGPSTPTVMATLNVAAFCNDPNIATQSFNFTDDSILDITADDGAGPYNDIAAITGAGGTVTFYAADPNTLPPAALTGPPALLTGTAITPNVDSNGDYVNTTVYVQYTDMNGCTTLVPVILDASGVCSACPTIGALTDPADVCAGTTFDLSATGLTIMDMASNGEADFGIDFVSFTGSTVPTNAYTGGTSLGIVPFGSLTNTNTQADLTGVGGALTAGDYVICAILSPASTQTGCAPQQCINITINPIPTITVMSTDPNACGATTGNFTVSGLTANDMYTITYTGTAGTPASGTVVTADASGEIQVTGLVADTYNISVTDVNGCTSTVSTAVLSDPGSPDPTGLMISVDDVCAGDDATVTITGANILPNATYTLTYDIGGNVFTQSVNIASGGSSFTITAPATGGTVSVTSIEDANGCSTGLLATDSFAVIPLPDAGMNGVAQVCDNNAEGNSVADLMAALSGTPDAGGTWSEVTTSGVSLANPTMVDFNGVAVGMYTFTYTVSAAPCADATADVVVTVTDCQTCTDIIIDATTTCNANGTYNILVNSITGGDGTGTDYTVSDGTNTITFPTTTSINNLSYTGTTSQPVVTLTVTDVDDTNCTGTTNVFELNCLAQTVCDCVNNAANPFTINVQASGNANGYQMVYVLVDGNGNVAAVPNQTGTFSGLPDDGTTYTIHAFNVANADVAAFIAEFVNGMAYPSDVGAGDPIVGNSGNFLNYCYSEMNTMIMENCNCNVPMIMVDKDDADNTDDTQVVSPGGTATFTITITNTGSEDLCNVVLTDTPTDGTLNVTMCEPTFASIDTDNGTVAAGAGDGILAVGDVETYTCTVMNVTANFTNTIEVEAEGCGSGTDVDDDDPTTVTTAMVFDLALDKVLNTAVSPGPFNPGDLVTYTICVYNQGDIVATNTEVTDYGSVNPTDLIYQNLGTLPTVTTQGTPVVVTDNTGGVFTIDNLNPGENVCVDIVYQIDPAFTTGNIINNAEITDASDIDEDSTPNDDSTNPPETGTDNNIDDDGTGGNGTPDNPNDSDDYDPVVIGVGLPCTAEAGVLDIDYQCPDTDAICTVTAHTNLAGFETWVILTDLNGNILGVFGPVNGSGQVTIPYSAWPATGNLLLYAFNFDTTLPPAQLPTGIGAGTATNINDLINDPTDCGDVSNTPEQIFISMPLISDCNNQVDEGNAGGISPFYYNRHEMCIKGGTPPYDYIWCTEGYVRHENTTVINYGGGIWGAEMAVFYDDNAVWAVTIYDANGCTSDDWRFTNDPVVEAWQQGGTPPPPGSKGSVLDIFYDYQISADQCYNSTGSLSMCVEGGNVGAYDYVYSWSGPYTWIQQLPGANLSAVTNITGSVPTANLTMWDAPTYFLNTYGTDIPPTDASPCYPGNAQAAVGTSNCLVLENLPQGWYSVTVTDPGTPPTGNSNDPNTDPSSTEEQTTIRWFWIHCNYANSGGGRGKTTEFDNGLGVLAYPNPFSDQTNVVLGVAETTRLQAVIFSVDGKQVAELFNGELPAHATHEATFNADHLPAGVYMLIVRTESGLVKHEKLVITK